MARRKPETYRGFTLLHDTHRGKAIYYITVDGYIARGPTGEELFARSLKDAKLTVDWLLDDDHSDRRRR